MITKAFAFTVILVAVAAAAALSRELTDVLRVVAVGA
jgi:hypothetical protein